MKKISQEKKVTWRSNTVEEHYKKKNAMIVRRTQVFTHLGERKGNIQFRIACPLWMLHAHLNSMTAHYKYRNLFL